MKRSRPFIVLLGCGLAALPTVAAAPTPVSRPAEHVVIVSFDGLRPEFYLDPRWPAPMLQQMRREGAYAETVTGVFPSVTYPSHTTMLTGVLPAVHGIDYNTPFEPDGQSGRWYWEERQIRVPTLWDAVRQAGLKTASVFWPVSVGAPVDLNLPEIWPLTEGVDFLTPIREQTRPQGLLEEIEREATGRLSSRNFSFGTLSLDDRTGEMAAYLLETHLPNLLTVHLIGADDRQHQEGREGPDVSRAVAAVDRAIAKIVEAAERAGILQRTAFVVVGDHGFVDLHTEVAPNVWLVEAGLMEARPDRGRWRATFHNSSAAAFLHLASANDRDALAAVLQILEAQSPEVRALFRILDRQELDRRGAAPAAALALAPAPGVYITSSYEPPPLRPKTGAGHGHLPELPEAHTGLVAWGSGIRAGGVEPLLTLEQVAPLVCALLGLQMDRVTAQSPDLLLEPVTSP